MALTASDIQEMISNENLTEEEQKYLQMILQEMSTNGKSKTLNDVWSTDYEEIPVSIEQFISDDRYLGNSLKDAQGNLTMYPYWVNVLKKIFSPDAKYAEVALSGCIGSGKSTIAVVALCYMLYKLLCLKNPAGYYKLNKGSKIAIAFFNLNMEQAMGVGYTRMQNYLKASPWFMEHGEV